MEVVHPSYAKKAIHRIGSLYRASPSLPSNPKHSTVYPEVTDIYKPIIYPLIEKLPHVGRSLENAPLSSWKSKEASYEQSLANEVLLLNVRRVTASFSLFSAITLTDRTLRLVSGSQPTRWRAVKSLRHSRTKESLNSNSLFAQLSSRSIRTIWSFWTDWWAWKWEEIVKMITMPFCFCFTFV